MKEYYEVSYSIYSRTSEIQFEGFAMGVLIVLVWEYSGITLDWIAKHFKVNNITHSITIDSIKKLSDIERYVAFDLNNKIAIEI
jgi:hypothetical protein